MQQIQCTGEGSGHEQTGENGPLQHHLSLLPDMPAAHPGKEIVAFPFFASIQLDHNCATAMGANRDVQHHSPSGDRVNSRGWQFSNPKAGTPVSTALEYGPH